MKTGISLLLRWSPLLAIFCATRLPSHGQDYLTFSVPLLVAADGPAQGPAASYSFTRTFPAHGFIASDRSVATVNGIGLPLGSSSGAELAADAYQYLFPDALQRRTGESLDLLSLKGVDATLGVWHRFSENWTGEAALTESWVREIYESLYIPAEPFLLPTGEIYRGAYEKFPISTHTFTYSGGVKYQVNDRLRAYAILGITRRSYFSRGNNHFGIGAGVQWDVSDRWRIELGVPRTVVGYRLLGGAYVYSGVVFGGNFLTPTQVTAGGFAQSTASDYRETDLSAGILWNIGKGWKIDLSAGVPISQSFSFR